MNKKFVKKYAVYIAIGVILIAGIIVALIIGDAGSKPGGHSKLVASVAPCGPYRSDGNIVVNGQKINVEIAKNPTEFEKGLGGRPCILPNQGMWFSFKTPGQYAFWMKDMKFPIDVVWIGADHKVAAIEIDFQPSTYPEKRENQKPAQYVLELKANRSKQLHMQIGTPVLF